MLSCPICEQLETTFWAIKNNYQLYKCLNCTHIFADISSTLTSSVDTLKENEFRKIITNSLMDSDEAFFQHLCEGEKEGFHTNITFKNINKLICQYHFSDNKKWLDVGCGSGYILKMMHGQGWNTTGIEPGEWGQIAAKKRGLNIIKGFLTRDTFPSNIKFDVVSATDVLEHQSNPYEFVNLLKHYLKKDGVLVLSLPFTDSFFSKVLKSNWNMIAPPTHCQFFSLKSLNIFAHKSGFYLREKIQYNSTRIPYLGRFNIFNKILDYLLQITNSGDQVILILQQKG